MKTMNKGTEFRKDKKEGWIRRRGNKIEERWKKMKG